MPSILCIEDEKDLRDDLVELLRESGYHTYEASNGLEGIDIIRRDHPDLVLCDITMPKMNGYQLLEELRDKYPEHADTPFIFLSALADRKDVIAGKQLGVDDYLTKPFDYLELKATIQARLGQVERMNKLKHRELSEVREEIMLLLPHELRTPLTHIIGFSEILKDQSFGPIGNEKYLDYANEIYQAGRHLNNTVESILTLANIMSKRDQPNITPCNVNACVEEIFKLHGQQAAKVGADFTYDVSPDTPLVGGDRSLIRQSLSALVSNAFKFSSQKGRVDLQASPGDDAGWVRIEVRDQGIGMSQDDLNEALKPFSQLDKGMCRRFEGIGLGLALAKAVTESIGGDLVINSAINSGTTVTMLLPEWTGECIG